MKDPIAEVERLRAERLKKKADKLRLKELYLDLEEDEQDLKKREEASRQHPRSLHFLRGSATSSQEEDEGIVEGEYIGPGKGWPGADSMKIDAELAERLAKMDDETRSKVVGSLAMIRASGGRGGGGGGGMDPAMMIMMMPMLMGYAKANPSSDANQYVTFAEKMGGMFKTGFELASAGRGDGSGGYSPIELMDKTYELLSKSQPQASTEDPLEKMTNYVELLEKAGLVVPVSKLKEGSTLTKEMKELELNTQVRLSQIDQDTKIQLAKLGLEAKNSDRMTQATKGLLHEVKRLIDIKEKQVEDAEEEEASQQPKRVVRRQQQQQQQSQSPESLKCNECGTSIPIPKDVKDGQLIECPNENCKKQYYWTVQKIRQ